MLPVPDSSDVQMSPVPDSSNFQEDLPQVQFSLVPESEQQVLPEFITQNCFVVYKDKSTNEKITQGPFDASEAKEELEKVSDAVKRAVICLSSSNTGRRTL